MPVFALWSAPRARSTAFFRSMLERGDLLALHEPIEGLMYFGDTEVEGRTFESPVSLLAWLREETHDVSVFLKETTDSRVREVVLADRRFLAEARHAFLIRRPEEIAASLYALMTTFEQPHRDMRIEDIGLEALHELHAAVHDAGGNRPVVIDSDDLVARPEATMAAYCAAVELPFIPQALTWEPGERPEWRRSARWHADASASSGFEQRERRYTHTVETSDELARFAAHHLPFYEQLHAHRVDVAAWEPRAGPGS
jgi:Sulfotransferase domain